MMIARVLKWSSSESWYFCSVLRHGERLDLGLGRIVDAAVQVAVGMGGGGVGEESMRAWI